MNQPGAPKTSWFEFGEFRIDTGRGILLRASKTIALTPRQFDTLLYLVEHCHRVITKEELMKAIWSDAFVEDNNLNQSVSAIRRVLGERRGDNRYIITVPGVGYRFAAPVKLVSPAEHTAAPARSLAVLPFKPLLEKERDEALELGMADSLIIRLSNSSSDMIVRPLSSVRRYGGLEQDPLSAGRELRVESVLDGSLQRAGDRI